MEELQDIEEDAGLGNGGLGRLAGEFLLLGSLLVYLAVSPLEIVLPTTVMLSGQDNPVSPHLSRPSPCALSLLPRFHGVSGTGSLRLRHPL